MQQTNKICRWIRFTLKKLHYKIWFKKLKFCSKNQAQFISIIIYIGHTVVRELNAGIFFYRIISIRRNKIYYSTCGCRFVISCQPNSIRSNGLQKQQHFWSYLKEKKILKSTYRFWLFLPIDQSKVTWNLAETKIPLRHSIAKQFSFVKKWLYLITWIISVETLLG